MKTVQITSYGTLYPSKFNVQNFFLNKKQAAFVPESCLVKIHILYHETLEKSIAMGSYPQALLMGLGG